MRVFNIIAAAALALPAIAGAQVGPNPAVSGGSLDPTVGASSDIMTAPQDSRVGTQAGGNVIDRTIGGSTGADATASTPTDAAAEASVTAGGTATTSTGTTTDTKATTKPMKPAHKMRR